MVAAPTGSGKTGVMELALLRLMTRHLDPATGALNVKHGIVKALYVAPLRALVQEKHRDWTHRCVGLQDA